MGQGQLLVFTNDSSDLSRFANKVLSISMAWTSCPFFKQFSGKSSQAGADLDDGHTIRQVGHFDRFFDDIPVGEEILSELFSDGAPIDSKFASFRKASVAWRVRVWRGSLFSFFHFDEALRITGSHEGFSAKYGIRSR